MFVHYRTVGIVLKKTDRGEADQLFSVYTRDFGRVEILGRAIRKISSKLKSGIDIFYFSEVEFIQGKGYKTLTDAIVLNRFENLRRSLKKLAIAYRISEVSDMIIVGQEKDKKIWRLIEETFDRLDKIDSKKKDVELLLLYFICNLVSESGYALELYNCVSCEKKIIPEKLYFDPALGGILCQKCGSMLEKTVRQVNLSTVKILRLIFKKDWGLLGKIKLEPEDKKSLRNACGEYLSYASEK